MTDKEKAHIEFWASLDALNEIEKLRQSANINQIQFQQISNLFLFSIIRLEDALTTYANILKQEFRKKEDKKTKE